jgi:hypothetical protein
MIPRWFLPGCLVLMAGCGSVPTRIPSTELPEVTIDSVQPELLLPGTWILVYGKGFTAPATGNLSVSLLSAGNQLDLSWERVDDSMLAFRVTPALFESLGGAGTFTGNIHVEVIDYPTGASRSADHQVQWDLHRQLRPVLSHFSAGNGNEPVYLGSLVEASGSGFLLEGEGITELHFSGSFQPRGSQDFEELHSACRLPRTNRELLQGSFPAQALGIAPGRFTGSISVVNQHLDGTEVEGAGLPGVTIDMGPTTILELSTTEARRGQWIQFTGRGFVGGSAITVIEVVGSFTSQDGKTTDYPQSDPLVLVPEVIDGETLRIVLRVTEDAFGEPQGLGATAGTLQGLATPLVYFGADFQPGQPIQREFTLAILPQRQVVFLKFLPGFTDALREFGLRNVEMPIRERILEVVRRDYAGINIEFLTQRPTDFAEYSVIEIGGVDPNGMGLLGLDNTMTKDTNNIHFDDVIGGMSLTESGHPAYGGVFVSSYLAFSPQHPYPLAIASPAFDEIFGPFVPFLGGRPVEAKEFPSGPRAAVIESASRALANMIGNTVSHEIGHSLGLASGPASQMHNAVPGPDQIMDAGVDREFEERAEINGRGPARWTSKNLSYLEKILPR